MDELVKELRNYLADTRRREEAADRRNRELVEALNRVAKAVADAGQLMQHTVLDTSRR